MTLSNTSSISKIPLTLLPQEKRVPLVQRSNWCIDPIAISDTTKSGLSFWYWTSLGTKIFCSCWWGTPSIPCEFFPHA